jgi:hypothetical protein
MLPDDPLSQVLTIDLSARSARVERRPELFEQGLGGAGAAIRLLEEECPKGADPLGPENPIILASCLCQYADCIGAPAEHGDEHIGINDRAHSPSPGVVRHNRSR